MDELPPAFVRALQEERETLNERFRLRQLAGQRIDGGALLAHLAHAIAPLVEHVESCLPERTRGVLVQLYEVSLDLFGTSQLGPSAPTHWVQRMWDEVLPQVPPRLLAMHTQQVAGSLSNAVVKLASQQGARPHDWINAMRRVVPHCTSVGDLLDVGQVLAWRSGMVQYRRAALDIAIRLTENLTRLALGLADDCSVAELIGRLQGNIWLNAATTVPPDSARLQCVGKIGAFTGFGGIFSRPPVVTLQGDRFLATDQHSTWEMHFDAYGVWFQRVDLALAKQNAAANKPEVTIDRLGTIRWGKLALSAPELVNATSLACDGRTAAVTIPTSHHVFLYSVAGVA